MFFKKILKRPVKRLKKIYLLCGYWPGLWYVKFKLRLIGQVIKLPHWTRASNFCYLVVIKSKDQENIYLIKLINPFLRLLRWLEQKPLDPFNLLHSHLDKLLESSAKYCVPPVKILGGYIGLKYLPQAVTLKQITVAEEWVIQDLEQQISRLHQAGLSHGDIAASNIVILPEDRQVYLVDLEGLKNACLVNCRQDLNSLKQLKQKLVVDY